MSSFDDIYEKILQYPTIILHRHTSQIQTLSAHKLDLLVRLWKSSQTSAFFVLVKMTKVI